MKFSYRYRSNKLYEDVRTVSYLAKTNKTTVKVILCVVLYFLRDIQVYVQGNGAIIAHFKYISNSISLYGWYSSGRESLLDECHQNVRTLGLLTRSVLIEIAWGFLRLVRNCHWKDDIKKHQ